MMDEKMSLKDGMECPHCGKTVMLAKAGENSVTDNATPRAKNAAAMPMDTLKKSLKGSDPAFYSEK